LLIKRLRKKTRSGPADRVLISKGILDSVDAAEALAA
jgi:hypothetical protein